MRSIWRTTCPVATAGLLGLALVACTGPNLAYTRPRDSGQVGRDGVADALSPEVATDGRVSDVAGLPDLSTGLIAYWRMNELSGGVAHDSAGGTHDAILEPPMPAQVWGRPGRFETAIEFPAGAGETAGIRVPTSAAIEALHHYTLAAWIWRTVSRPNDYNFIVSRQYADTNSEVFSLGVVRDQLRAWAPYDPALPVASVSGPGTIPLGQWVHVAVTYDGATLTLYQAGQAVQTGTRSLPILPRTSKPCFIGTNQNATGYEAEPFVGYLDEVMIYRVALGREQIQALADGRRPPVP